MLLLQVLFIEHGGHEVPFLHADAVFARQRAADLHAQAQNVRAEFLGLAQFFGVVGVKQDQGMQVAVASVKHIGDPQAVLPGQLADSGEDLGQPAAGDGAVHAVVIRRDVPQGRKSRFAAGPDADPLLFGLADPHRLHLAALSDAPHLFDQLRHLACRPVQFHDHQGRTFHRVARLAVVLGGLDGELVHHLYPGGDDAAGDDPRHAVPGGLVAGKAQQHGPGRLRLGDDAHGHLRDHA